MQIVEQKHRNKLKATMGEAEYKKQQAEYMKEYRRKQLQLKKETEKKEEIDKYVIRCY